MKTSPIALAFVALITTTLVGGCISVKKDEAPSSTTSTTTRTTEVTPAYVAPSTTTVQRTTY